MLNRLLEYVSFIFVYISALFIVDLKLFGFKDVCEKFRSSTLGQPPQGQHEIL